MSCRRFPSLRAYSAEREEPPCESESLGGCKPHRESSLSARGDARGDNRSPKPTAVIGNQEADLNSSSCLNISVDDTACDDVFHSARSSPLVYRNSMSSNRIPSPLGPDRSLINPRPPPIILQPKQQLEFKQENESEGIRASLAIPRSLSSHTVQPITPASQQPEVSNVKGSIKRKPLRADHDVVQPHFTNQPWTMATKPFSHTGDAPTKAIRETFPNHSPSVPKHYPNQVNAELDKAFEEAQDFDLAELDGGQDVPLAPHIAKQLQEVAQHYLPQNPRYLSPQTRPSTPTQSRLRVPSPKRRLFRRAKEISEGPQQAKLRQNHTNDSAADDDGDGSDDPDFCCAYCKSAAARNDLSVSFCYSCRMTYCTKHWIKETPHKRNKPGHEKVDVAVARMIEKTLEIDISDNEQAKLHLKDETTSWFGAMHEEDGVVFRDFGRYASIMADHSLADRELCYPALVSFVGDTGAGKSSLIKLLVGLKNAKTMQKEKKPTQTPVVGNNGAATPTSGDVHLYADPETFFTERPLLYADCEGLRGGTLEPIGARRRRILHGNKSSRARTASFEKHMRRKHQTAEREVEWATTPERSTRRYFVEHLYPRLLYTFSDVIVFVVKNARMIEDVMEQLIVWADAVIETASNQPVLPHAIIVLNASDNQESRLWDVNSSTTALLDDISQAVTENPRLKTFAAKWNQRGFRIDSVQSLLLAYYSSIRVVRIPEKSQPCLIHSQIQELYVEIGDAVTASHHAKHQKRLKLNAEALQPYLQRAFDHFCRDLNDPFDFIKASFADSGIPSDFCGNTLKLAVDIMAQWSSRIDGGLLFRELSFIVASCVMLDAVRNHKLGEAGAIFKEYIDHFDETLDDFCEKVWPCEFVSLRGRCVNVRAGHTKGHQVSKGQVMAGDYQSYFSAATHRQKYRRDVFANLQELLARLMKSNHSELEAAATLHRDTILEPFYQHWGGADLFVSHSACLSCLVAPAEHCLPCGHVLCTPCVKDFGTYRGQSAVEMKYCPLHKSETKWRRTIALKPESAGTRVLSMDGGGVRGIILLMILQQLERDLGSMPIQAFFDLVIGTSTGGIIALGLVEMGWSVSTCLNKFEELARIAFQKHKFLRSDYLEFLVAAYQQGRYKVEPLEDILTSQYTERKLFGGVRNDLGFSTGHLTTCKVGVTATSTSGTPFLLANYNRIDKTENARYKFLRAEKPGEEISIWEAARVTSAAPKIFKPYGHVSSGHTFIDGGVYYNNPVEVALREHALIWPQNKLRLPDVMLSLGTGCSQKKQGIVTPSHPASKNISGILSYYKQLLKIATDHVKNSQRSEEEYHRVVQASAASPQAKNCFQRLNIFFPADFVSLKPDKVENMPYMQEFANLDLDRRHKEIRQIANRLIAASFYFEPLPGSFKRDLEGSVSLQGYIRCRFQQHSAELRYLGDLLRSRIQEAVKSPGGARHSACFVIEHRSRPQDAVQVLITDGVLNNMQAYGELNFGQITITVPNSNLESDIYLRFGAEDDQAEHNSISGFPRYWDDKRLHPMASRLSLSEARARQPSRRGRPEWSEPTSTLIPVLERYVKERNPGLATDEQMVAVEDRLNGPSPSQMPAVELEGDYEPKSIYWMPDLKAIPVMEAHEITGTESAPALPPPTPVPLSPIESPFELEGSCPAPTARTSPFFIAPLDYRSLRAVRPDLYGNDQHNRHESNDVYGPGW